MKLLRNNTKLHAASTIKDIIMSLIWDVFQQSAYSLHITPSDCLDRYSTLIRYSLAISGDTEMNLSFG